MLDRKTEAVLAMLSEQVGYSYKVVNKAELAAKMPKRFAVNEDKLIAVIAFLKENDYLTVKYQDKDEICLALSVKSETYLSQKDHISAQTKISGKQIVLLFFGVFAASLLGTLAAELLMRLF